MHGSLPWTYHILPVCPKMVIRFMSLLLVCLPIVCASYAAYPGPIERNSKLVGEAFANLHPHAISIMTLLNTVKQHYYEGPERPSFVFYVFTTTLEPNSITKLSTILFYQTRKQSKTDKILYPLCSCNSKCLKTNFISCKKRYYCI